MPQLKRKTSSTERAIAIHDAIAVIRKHGISAHSVSKEYNIPRSTLLRWLNDPPSFIGSGRKTELTTKEEETIVCALKFIAKCGFPLAREDVKCLVQSYVNSMRRKTRFKDGKPGTDWMYLFERRHPSILSIRKPELLTLAHAEGLSINTINCFFDIYETFINDNHLKLKPHCIFYCDETSLSTDRVGEKVFVRREDRNAYLKSTGKGENIFTVLCCVSASGVYLPPLTVYKAKQIQKIWTHGGPTGAVYSVSDSGWMVDNNFEKWFVNVFVEHVKTYEKPVLLSYEGHNSHLTYKTVKSAIDQNIIILCLPPNTSHALQPLDVGVFRPAKVIWKKILNNWYVQSQMKSVKKSVFPSLLKKLWDNLEPAHAVKGFKGAGLFPPNRKAISHRIVQPKTETDYETPKKGRPRTLSVIAPQASNETKAIKEQSSKKQAIIESKVGQVLTEEKVLKQLKDEAENRKEFHSKMSTPARKSGRPAKPTEKFKEYFKESEVPPKKDSKSLITRHTQISKEKPLKKDITSVTIKKRGRSGKAVESESEDEGIESDTKSSKFKKAKKDSVPAVTITHINGSSVPLQSIDKAAKIEYNNGEQVQVLDMRDNKWYQCKIVDVNSGAKSVLVHYNRWSSRFDEWINMNSFRIQPSHNSMSKIELKRQPTIAGKKEVDGPTKLLEVENTPTKIKSKSVVVEDCNKDVEVPKGWTRMVVMRTNGVTAGTCDVYYTSPLGKKLRSKVQVEHYCKGTGLTIDLGALKFSHQASEAEKAALFLKADNDLAVDITTETEDNKKVFHSKMSSPAQKSGHQTKPTEKNKEKSEVPPKKDSKSPITGHTQTSNKKSLKPETTSHTINKKRGRTHQSIVDTNSLKNKKKELESEDKDNNDTKGSKFNKEPEVLPKKDTKSLITFRHIQTSEENPLKPDTTSCTIIKKRGRPCKSIVDTESSKNKNNESGSEDEDNNDTKGRKLKKVFHSKMSTPARKSGRQAKTTENSTENPDNSDSDGKPNLPNSARAPLCPSFENNIPLKHTTSKVEASAVSYATMTKLGTSKKETRPPNSVMPGQVSKESVGVNIVCDMSDVAKDSSETKLNPDDDIKKVTPSTNPDDDLKKIIPSTNKEKKHNWDKALAKMTEVFTWVNTAPEEMKEKVNELTLRFFACIDILQFKHRTSHPIHRLK